LLTQTIFERKAGSQEGNCRDVAVFLSLLIMKLLGRALVAVETKTLTI
jgi:hypothetical protein